MGSVSLILLAVVICSAGCAVGPEPTNHADTATARRPLDPIAEEYVRLVLAVGLHDADYVDAYYGPEDWRRQAEAEALGLETIGRQAKAARSRLPPLPGDLDEMLALRRRYLDAQLGALAARVEMLRGVKLGFDEESEALYGTVAPSHTDDYYLAMVSELEALLPGEGSIYERYNAFKRDFIIPPERLDAVFRRAIEACRERTLDHLELPREESFEIGYVTGTSWGAYNWYQGGYKSLIQVNTDLPVYIDRALDLACHEGYPGHHVYNVLLEKHLVRDRGWVEYSVYALFSGQSLIAEGTAKYGIQVAFPGDERTAFERDVLYPLAGLDPQRAELYSRIREQVERLAYAGIDAARRYLDGEIDGQAAAAWMTRHAMSTPERAAKRVRFFDQYRSYIINYALGRDLVRRHVEAKSGGGGPDEAWTELGKLLASPRLPGGLEP